jgi:hypothetical protein
LEGEAKHVVTAVVNTIAVPGFFLVDGFLFSLKQLERQFDYKKYLKKSLKRLILPWIVFNVLYFAIRLVFEYKGFLDNTLILNSSVGSGLLLVYGSAIAPQMYFLLSLFIIRVFSFALRKLTVVAPVWLITGMVVYAGAFGQINFRSYFVEGLDPILHAIWGLQFYLLGFVLFRLREFVSRYALKMVLFSLVICTASVIAGAIMLAEGIFQYSYLIGAYCAFLLMRDWGGVLSRVGRDTMGIYLLHCPVLLKCVSVVFTWIVVSDVLAFILVAVSTYLASFYIYRVIFRFRYVEYAFGRF